MPVNRMKQSDCNGNWCEMVIHTKLGESGILKNVSFDKEISEKYIKLVDMSVKPGDVVKPFTGANTSLGDIFLKFDSREELNRIVFDSNEWLHIDVEDK